VIYVSKIRPFIVFPQFWPFFFLFMTVMTICSTTFHYSSWILKFSLLSTLFTVSFFIPGQFFAMYREASRWGSLLFIVTQVLVLVDFAHTVHENLVKYVGDDGDESSPNATKARALYLGLSIFSIISFIIGVIFLYIKYNPCSLHATMISLTLIFGVIVTALSLLDVISKGLLPPTLLSAYCVLIVYQALSTNTIDSCTASDVSKDMPTWLVIVSFILSICQVAWMGIRAGSNNRAFVDTSVSQYTRSPLSEQSQANINNTRDPYNNNDDNSNDLPGGRYQALETEKGAEKQQQESSGATRHWIFHLTLVLCSMYIAMMLTGWGSEEATSFNNPEASEQSFWIKMISVFASFGLYFWTLIAPIIFPNRDFS